MGESLGKEFTKKKQQQLFKKETQGRDCESCKGAIRKENCFLPLGVAVTMQGLRPLQPLCDPEKTEQPDEGGLGNRWK